MTTKTAKKYPDDTLGFDAWQKMSPEKRRALKMSPEQREKYYQHDVYLRNRADRAANAKERWDKPEYRKREIERAQDRRAVARSENAPERFEKMIESAQAVAPPVRPPIEAEIDGDKLLVYSTTVLGLKCGRKVSTIRQWVEEGVLPGCTVVVGGRAKFSEPFMEAVREACKRVLYLDGRGNHTQLKLLVIEELELRGESYVPIEKAIEPDNERPSLRESGPRVWPSKKRR